MSPDLFLDGILCIINDNSDKNRRLINNLIELFEVNSKNNTTIDNDITRFYIRILKNIIHSNTSKDNMDELKLILLKFQSDPILSKRKDVYSLLTDIFSSSERLTKERQEQIQLGIQNTLLWTELNKSTKLQFAALSRSSELVSPQDQAYELRKIKNAADNIATAFSEKSTISSRTEPVESIDLSDKSSMDAGLKKYKERIVQGVLKTGWQGLNRMLGSNGGLVRGESIVIYALKHNYKSGLLMSIASWIAIYNTPVITGENSHKKKLILLLSLENEAYQNFILMFRHQYETTMNVSSKSLTDEEITDWCYNLFNRNGYTIRIERFLPHNFKYSTLVETIEYYENSNYEVVAVGLDYLNLANKDMETGRAEANHLSVRAIFSACCNYCKSKGITFITAHPLNRKAAELKTTGITNVVRRYDETHLADSVDVAREVDVEVFIQIEKNLEGYYYLTCQRGKHRYVNDTPEAHKYFAMRFGKFGIPDDLNSPIPWFVTDIYADQVYDDPITKQEPNLPNDTGDTEAEMVF